MHLVSLDQNSRLRKIIHILQIIAVRITWNYIRGRPELSTFSTYEITSHNFLTPSPSAYEIYIFHGSVICRSQLGESTSMDLSMANHPMWWHILLHKFVHFSQSWICCTKCMRLSTFFATPSPPLMRCYLISGKCRYFWTAPYTKIGLKILCLLLDIHAKWLHSKKRLSTQHFFSWPTLGRSGILTTDGNNCQLQFWSEINKSCRWQMCSLQHQVAFFFLSDYMYLNQKKTEEGCLSMLQ